jgi:hypothetical protein
MICVPQHAEDCSELCQRLASGVLDCQESGAGLLGVRVEDCCGPASLQVIIAMLCEMTS